MPVVRLWLTRWAHIHCANWLGAYYNFTANDTQLPSDPTW